MPWPWPAATSSGSPTTLCPGRECARPWSRGARPGAARGRGAAARAGGWRGRGRGGRGRLRRPRRLPRPGHLVRVGGARRFHLGRARAGRRVRGRRLQLPHLVQEREPARVARRRAGRDGPRLLICCFAAETGEPITNPHHQAGTAVTVVGVPAAPQWRTPGGVATLGPRHFGFDLDFVPFEEGAPVKRLLPELFARAPRGRGARARWVESGNGGSVVTAWLLAIGRMLGLGSFAGIRPSLTLAVIGVVSYFDWGVHTNSAFSWLSHWLTNRRVRRARHPRVDVRRILQARPSAGPAD